MGLQIFRQTHLPYILKEISNGEFVVLNREYCYVGTNIGDSVAPPFGTIRLKLTKRKLDSLGLIKSESRPEYFALYNDRTNPSNGKSELKSYFEKLEKLMPVENTDEGCMPIHKEDIEKLLPQP